MYRGRTFNRETVYFTGEHIDGEIYPVFQPAGKRRKKCRPTSAVQARLNQRNAEKKLTRLVRMNFGANDCAIHCTYRPADEPEGAAEAQRDAQNFIKRLKRLYRKAGVELKYVYATECGKNGGWHHHFILTGGVDRDDIENAWGNGFANAKRLKLEEDGLAGLSRYIVKERRFYKRWSGSRNLLHPEPMQCDGQLSMFDVEEAAEAIEEGRAHEWFESRWPDFELIEASCERNGINRGVYIRFEMRKRRESTEKYSRSRERARGVRL